MKKKKILSFLENDLVIHIKYGIGQYKGLSIIKHNNILNEYITILYANNDKLYIPISNLYLIKKYNSNFNNKKIILNKLGCEKWNIERKRIFKNINDTAIQILENHANRMTKLGFSFQNYNKEYELFCKMCPFEMTKDQNLAMKSVLLDMNKSIPMDRLICGDVGFGKTEIAIRASFIAVKNKKQVLILAPTTILAQQHYKTFKNRFLKYNIKIGILSRFQKKSKQLILMNHINTGNINIIIATHKILFNNLKWYNLGLLIIDEEHKFGVNQKENIRKMFSHIDVLTLTATPIPRTLNMAINGILDLSIISTPPKNRLPVKTFVKIYNKKLIRKIILFEISRNGQLYFICNKIQNLKEKLIILKKIVPEAKFQIAHGKMNSEILKKIMNNFLKKKFQILICTTIIEIGIDIPSVNSIIIEDAEYFGLAQLHQLRGRVGRSNIQSYAWFLIKNKKTISLNGKKRLEAINSNQNFNSGFELSKHDLEIRGVGELLGKNQSGHSKNIELSLYIKFLNKAIKYIKNNKSLSLHELEQENPEIKLSIPTIFPEKYISDINLRLIWYKKIFSINNIDKLLKIKKKLINKFGILPIEVKNLIIMIKIKIFSKKMGILKIKSNKKNTIIIFSKQNNLIDITKLLNICKIEFKKWKLNDQYSLKISYYITDDKKRIKWIFYILKKIKNSIIINN